MTYQQLLKDIEDMNKLLKEYKNGNKMVNWEKAWEKVAKNNPDKLIEDGKKLTDFITKIQAEASALKGMIGYGPVLNWKVMLEYQIRVDFR